MPTTFDFSTGVTDGSNGGPDFTMVEQTLGGDTLIVALDPGAGGNAVVMNELDFYGEDIANLDGAAFETTFGNPFGSATLSLDSGRAFDLTCINLFDSAGGTSIFVFTTSKGDVQVTVDSDNGAVVIPLNDPKLQGVTSVVITQQGGSGYISLDNVQLDNTAPTFVGVGTTLTAAQNGASVDAKSLLHVSDTDSAQTVTWSQHTGPSHGTLNITGVTAASGSADITPGGTLTYTPAAGFSGVDTFTVQVSDGTSTDTREITVNVGPATPGTPDLAAVSDTGLFTDNITSAASLNFSGLSGAGDTTSMVRVFLDKNNNGVYDGGTDIIGAATVANGSWSVTGLSTVGLSDGDYNVYAQVTSADGSLTSALSSALSVHIDKTKPTQTVSIVSLSADTGSSSSDFITKTAAQTVNATLSGVLNAGEDLYGSVDNGGVWTKISSMVTGTTVTWTGVTLSGNSTLQLKVIDTAGNEGLTASQPYSLDTIVPTQTVSGWSLSDDWGVSRTDFITNVAAQTVNATLSAVLGAGDALYGSVNNGASWVDITSKVTGTTVTWTGVTLSGSSALQLKVMDTAGNESLTASKAYSLDTTLPTQTVSGLSLSADTGSSSSDFITKTAAQTVSATLSGVLGADEILLGSVNDGATWTYITDMVNGTTVTWTGVTLSGSSALKMMVGDTAGNVGNAASQGYILDTILPTQTVSGLSLSDDTGSSDSDFITKAAAQTVSATLSGVLGLGDAVYASLDNGVIWTDITNMVSGTTVTWTGVTLSGSSTLKMMVVDNAGNEGVAASKTYMIDTVQPVQPSTPVLDPLSDTGASNSDNLTDDTTPTFSGTAENNAKIKLYDGDGTTLLGVGTADGSGHWQITSSSLAPGSHTVFVKATDAAGNVSSASLGREVIIRTANTAPTGDVTISGTATKGQTLTASNTLADFDGMGPVSYQWKSDGANIVGATSSTLVLANAHVGHVITVVASYTDGFNTPESETSLATASVANVNAAPGGSVSITGTATQGQTLNASNTLTDADGMGTVSYQWKSDGADIAGATSSSLVLAQAHVGHAITVVASYTDGFNTVESVSSLATASVGNINDAPTGAPAISGAAMDGVVLTAATTGIADLDGLGAFSYVWKADGTTINGATVATFTLTGDQVGKAITVTVSYTDGFGHAESLISAATATVQAQPEPEPPVVTPPKPPTLPEVVAAAGDALGVDAASPKATSPTVVLADGTIVANPVFAALEAAKLISAQLTAGTITTAQAKDMLVDLAMPTQLVAHETYNFFTGAPPTAAGFTYLIDSPINTTDLTDGYYAKFSTLNRYINFAVNLGSVGDGKAGFQASYGALTFEQAVSKAYDAVIGDQTAHGFDPVASKAYVLSQLSYFTALGGSDLGAKAAMVGFLLGVGAAEHVGPYYQAAYDFVAPQIQLVASSSSLVADFV